MDFLCFAACHPCLLEIVLTSPQIVIILPRTYEKPSCKGEPYRIHIQPEPSVQTNKETNRQTDILLHYYKDFIYVLMYSYVNIINSLQTKFEFHWESLDTLNCLINLFITMQVYKTSGYAPKGL